MAKPEPVRPTVVAKPVIRTHTPAKRVIVERFGNNQYRVVEEEYDCPPTSRRVLQPDVTRVPAEDEVRLWLVNHLGHNRFGDSGL
jgi:hypothetical protein